MGRSVAERGRLIRKAPLPHVEAEPIEEPNNGETSKTSIFQFPHLWLGVVALFVYVGAEVIAGDTIIAYGISLGISGDEAKYFTTFTLMAMVATYGLGIFLIPKYIITIGIASHPDLLPVLIAE